MMFMVFESGHHISGRPYQNYGVIGKKTASEFVMKKHGLGRLSSDMYVINWKKTN